MASTGKSPSYLLHNSHSWYFRMAVPPDLRPLIGKRELKYSLKTGYMGVAKSKARLLAGLCQNLFNDVRWRMSVGKFNETTDLQELLDLFREWASGNLPPSEDANYTLTGFTDDRNDMLTGYSRAKARQATGDMSQIAKTTDDLLKRMGTHYRKIWSLDRF